MLKQLFILLLVLVSVRLMIRLLIKLCLLPLAIYGILTQTLLAEWAALHPVISIGIYAIMALLVILHWMQPVFQRIREHRVTQNMLLDCIHQAHAQGLSSDQYHLTMKSGIPTLEYKQ